MLGLTFGGIIMDKIKLKPCPFCGEKPYLERDEIFCNCGAKMSIPIFVWGGEVISDYENEKAETIKAWNRRVGEEDKHEAD